MAHTILCAIDLSEDSKEALRAAATMSTAPGSSLVLAHVWEPPSIHGPRSSDAALLAESRAHVEQEVAQWRTEAEELGATRVKIAMLSGTPWREIVDLANQDPTIHAIVMGTHNRKGLELTVLGSVAERVVRHAPCSVFVIRPQR